MVDLWYKNAVIYCLDVETFMDSNGDGVGDFQGLADRLDHIEDLGATCVWLLPFYPSPNRDNGYDITDFYAVDPRLGTLGDFVAFTHEAEERGLRVVVDLVANHTSVDHPWFQEARRDPNSRYRDWYVWSKEKPEGHPRGRRVPRRAGRGVDLRRGRRRLVSAPLLSAPGRPQHHQSRGQGRDREGDGVLAAARRVGLPHRRRAVPDRIQGRARARAPRRRPARLSRRDARLPVVAPRGGGDAGRGQHRERQGRRVFRRHRRPHAHDLQLHAQPACVPGLRARRRRADPPRHGRDPADPAQGAMGELPAQPRRDRSRPPHGEGARRGLRGLRPGEAHAGLRARRAPPPRAPCSAATSGA